MKALEELEFCILHWEKQGCCKFGGGRKCTECGAPFVLYKMLTGEVVHDKLELEEWKKRIESIKKG